jgi:Xaa-Pro dipeptidase
MHPDPERADCINNFLHKNGCAALLAWHPDEIVLLFGCLPHWGLTFALWPRDGRPVVYSPALEPDERLPLNCAVVRRFDWGVAGCSDPFGELRALLAGDIARLGLTNEEIGCFAGTSQRAPSSSPAECPPLPESAIQSVMDVAGRIRDLTPEMPRLFSFKTKLEIECIRKANQVAVCALESFFSNLHPGVTEAEIGGLVELEIQRQVGRDGICYARGFAAVQSGPNAAQSGRYNVSGGRCLSEGDLVLIELATCVDGYWSDLTRTGSVGTPCADHARLIDTVLTAQRAAISRVAPGVAAAEVDLAAREVLAKAGLEPFFTHATGHHVGFRYHDPGFALAPGVTTPLELGMVVTIEPGVYGAQFCGGVRFEENILVTEEGCEILSSPVSVKTQPGRITDGKFPPQ